MASVDGRLRPLTTGDAQRLLRGIVVPPRADGDQLARTAMAAVRRVARAGGHRLPADVPPAKLYVPAAVASATPAAQTTPTADPGGTPALLLALPAILVALGGGAAYHHRRTRTPPAARAEA